MVIEINKDIDRYKETVVMGLTARQLIFSVASVVVGGGIVLLLNPVIGLTPSVYVAIPAVAPIALGGFYSFNGMNFYQFMGRKLRMMFANRPLVYVSTESEEIIRGIRMEEETKKKAEKKTVKKKGGKQEHHEKEKGKQEDFEAMKKKTKKMLTAILGIIAAVIVGAVIYKVNQ